MKISFRIQKILKKIKYIYYKDNPFKVKMIEVKKQKIYKIIILVYQKIVLKKKLYFFVIKNNILKLFLLRKNYL